MANGCESGGQLDEASSLLILMISAPLIWTPQTPLKWNFLLAPEFAYEGAFPHHLPDKWDRALHHLWATMVRSTPYTPICAFG